MSWSVTLTCWHSEEPEGLARLGAPSSRDGVSSLGSERTASHGRDIDKDKSIVAFTCSPAGGFDSGKQCRGREDRFLLHPGIP